MDIGNLMGIILKLFLLVLLNEDLMAGSNESQSVDAFHPLLIWQYGIWANIYAPLRLVNALT